MMPGARFPHVQSRHQRENLSRRTDVCARSFGGSVSAASQSRFRTVSPATALPLSRTSYSFTSSATLFSKSLVTANNATCPKQQPKWLEKVILLDVDGVLHPHNVMYVHEQFKEVCMNLLKILVEMVSAMPDKRVAGEGESSDVTFSPVTIVLSSSWRLIPGAKETLRRMLKRGGLPEFKSQTPSIGQFARAAEILSWVNRYKPKAWIAIDDWPLMHGPESAKCGPQLEGHFVNTCAASGLVPKDIDFGIELFKRQLTEAA